MSRRTWYAFASVLVAVAASTGLAFAPSTAHAETAGVIYVVDSACCDGGNGGVIRVDPSQPAGSNQTLVSSGQNLKDPYGVVLAADGKLYVVDVDCCGGTGGVIRVNPSQPANSNQTVISSGQSFVDPISIVLGADGKLYVVDLHCCGGSGGVIRVDPSQPATTNQTVVSNGQSFAGPTGLAIGTDGKLYVADHTCCGGTGGVIRVDLSQPNGSNQTVISSGQSFVNPYGLTVFSDGQIYVVDTECCGGGNGGLIRVNPSQPANNNQTVISAGQSFVNPTGASLAADGTLYVADGICCSGNNGALIRVNPSQPANNNQTVISSGQSFSDPRRLAVVPGVSIADTSVVEGTGATVNALFSVTLAPWSPLTIAVPYTPATGTGSATADVDFNSAGGTVTFNPGQTSKTATVQVFGDAFAEPTETFTVTLQSPNGVGAAPGTATGTITDNDGAVTLSIGDVAVTEGNSGTTTATFTVTMAPASGQVVTVPYATSDGTAFASVAGLKRDYEPVSDMLTFQPGETSKPIVVFVNGDTADEPDETFFVTLANPTGGAALGKAQATGTIKDDDLPVACSPRPRVVVNQSVGGGKLQVHVESTLLNTNLPNPLQQFKFGAFQNAKVLMNGQPISSGQTVGMPANATAADFTVERVTAGQPTMVKLTVVDLCGDWQTFVGGGTGAGF
jgi:hypothetical protein